MSTDELVNVMVPREWLTQVYALIARLEHASPAPQDTLPASDNAAEQRSSADALDEWTPSRLRKMVAESPPAMRNILSALANRAGEWLTTEELAKAIQGDPDADWKTVAGTLGAFGRRVGHRYSLETYPFEARHDHEAKGRVYRMLPQMAQQVLHCLQNGK